LEPCLGTDVFDYWFAVLLQLDLVLDILYVYAV
jgi:hypothetical protein